MRASEVLKNEHIIIVGVLDCLDRMAAEAEKSGAFDAESAEAAADFLRNFADKCHHGKEEVHFFPMMEARGFPRDGGPTGVMLYEHEEGRALVRKISEAAKSGDAKSFIAAARGFSALLRQHIEKEDHCLFSMADQAFDANDQKSLERSFEKSEKNELAGLAEKYGAVAQGLREKFKLKP